MLVGRMGVLFSFTPSGWPGRSRWVTLNNMGAATREETTGFAVHVLEEVCPDWTMKWTKCDGGICLKRSLEILIPERMIGQYPWIAKEYVLHETAHIFTDDNQHGVEFYREYVALLDRFMVDRSR